MRLCKNRGKQIEIFRLLVAHSEFKPDVARENITFKITDVKKLCKDRLEK